MSKIKIVIIICALVFVISAAVCAVLLNASHGDIVEIKSGGELLYTIELAKSTDRTITVEFKGKENTIIIENHKIRVFEAGCPDKVCVNTGWLESPAIPIVCLPNRLVIKYADGGANIAAG